MRRKPRIITVKVGSSRRRPGEAVTQEHVCIPARTFVKPDDTVAWAGQDILVFFPGRTPFVEGRGPFVNGEVVTVKSRPPLKPGTFTPRIAIRGKLRLTRGDIIVTEAG